MTSCLCSHSEVEPERREHALQAEHLGKRVHGLCFHYCRHQRLHHCLRRPEPQRKFLKSLRSDWDSMGPWHQFLTDVDQQTPQWTASRTGSICYSAIVSPGDQTFYEDQVTVSAPCVCVCVLKEDSLCVCLHGSINKYVVFLFHRADSLCFTSFHALMETNAFSGFYKKKNVSKNNIVLVWVEATVNAPPLTDLLL